MRNALILHGAGNNSRGNWFPWLNQELEAIGYKVWVPNLPNSDIPIQNDWLDVIFSNKDWEFNEDSVMVGHSSGATLILRILEKLPDKIKINKAVLVAAPLELGSKPEYYGYKKDLVSKPFNWVKIKSSCKRFYFVHSDNDKYECGFMQGKIMQKNLGGELIIEAPTTLRSGNLNNALRPELKPVRSGIMSLHRPILRSGNSAKAG